MEIDKMEIEKTKRLHLDSFSKDRLTNAVCGFFVSGLFFAICFIILNCILESKGLISHDHVCIPFYIIGIVMCLGIAYFTLWTVFCSWTSVTITQFSDKQADQIDEMKEKIQKLEKKNKDLLQKLIVYSAHINKKEKETV